ncbi:hypothetical protein F0562_002290 [Nyssa sinensis]|uniref:RING-type domain-containing protein n=1 Tax=Nyssa sinensis TaxID=561372 RepID=A0A5J5C6J9_9ASTE|nr:hypothetical protein F0562_002290 [Nyssa sinensis]
MSTRGLRGPPLKGYVRNSRRRRMALDVDLNVLPSENHDQEGTSANAASQDAEAGQQGLPIPLAPIDVEAFDDDVIISSPRAFAEAKNNSRRNHGRAVVVDVDSEERTSRLTPNNRNKRRRVSSNQTIINCDLYINLEGSSYSTRDNVRSVVSPPMPPPPPPPPPPSKEPTFNCPVCMGPLVEEMSTKCGHIFCKGCIKAAIASQNKCPTCRRKVTMKDTIRVYLPSTS